jgi:alpha-tubulin suppressor-like RCC1 family protein
MFRIYEDSQNMSNILIKKYSRASEWCLKMTKLRIKDRPEVRDILKSRKSWTIEEEEGIKAINDEIDLNANKSNIYKFLRMKYLNLNKNSGQLNRRLSNKLNEYFERNIKLSFIYEKEVIIITKDDKFYKIGLNNNLSNLLGLNDGSLLIETALIQRLGKEVFKAFACGLSHVIALTEDGKIYCWGRNESGQLGNGITDFYDNEPQINHNLSDNIIEDIKCGSYHSLALTNGEVYAWGQNGSGQIGNDNNKDQLIPFKINSFGEEKIEAISCGSKHSLALTKSSHVFSWGLNDKGQLGNGEGEDSNVPKVVKVEDENKKSVICTKISCGSKHSLLLSSDGEIYAFGNNEFGQLGIENLDNKSFPTKIPNEKKFSDIASHFHSNMSFAKSNDNIFYYWGKCGDQIVSKPKETNFHSFNDLFLHYLKINYEPMKEGFSFDDTFIDNDRYFDLFENEKKLGSGNYGTVFKVMEKSTKKWFAIKKIAFKSENENQVLEQIKISDKIRKLDSKYLIKYFNAWFEEENSVPKRILLYIQMEVCDTKLLDIMEEMNENSNKNFDDVITYSVISELFFQLLCGVDYLHKQNIVHRNLNPSNILINKSIDKNFVKISGFGLAAFHEFEDHVRDQYRWHIKYAAPELLNGMISDEKVDIYSLGVVLQELFRIDFYGYLVFGISKYKPFHCIYFFKGMKRKNLYLIKLILFLKKQNKLESIANI